MLPTMNMARTTYINDLQHQMEIENEAHQTTKNLLMVSINPLLDQQWSTPNFQNENRQTAPLYYNWAQCPDRVMGCQIYFKFLLYVILFCVIGVDNKKL